MFLVTPKLFGYLGVIFYVDGVKCLAFLIINAGNIKLWALMCTNNTNVAIIQIKEHVYDFMVHILFLCKAAVLSQRLQAETQS